MRQANLAMAVAVAFAGVVTVAALAGRDAPGDAVPATTATSARRSATTTTAPPGPTTTTGPLDAPTTTSVPPAVPPTAPVELRTGASGADVAALEARLSALGFWLGEPDETFDTRTAHAVVAFQKLAGLPRHGVVDAGTRNALAAAARPQPRSPDGHVVEVDLTHQVLIVADAGAAVAVLDISTGRYTGTTPLGRFSVTREIDGYRRSSLGVLYRPKYFYEGVALHGYPSVPPYPASHGCVRTTNAAMDSVWASGSAPVGTAVWVYR